MLTLFCVQVKIIQYLTLNCVFVNNTCSSCITHILLLHIYIEVVHLLRIFQSHVFRKMPRSRPIIYRIVPNFQGNTFKNHKMLRRGMTRKFSSICGNSKRWCKFQKIHRMKFGKKSQNTYLDPIFTWESCQEIWIPKSCEKSELLEKNLKQTIFSYSSSFPKFWY